MERRDLEQLEAAADPPFDGRIETHISWVLLGARDVYKIKRPVDLGFLDFRVLEDRLRACEREVELNRRLAGEVYLGVVPIASDGGVPRIGAPGTPIEYAVHMRRLDDRDRADRRLEAGALGREEVEDLARMLARFHATCPPLAACDRAHGSADAIEANVDENFRQTRAVIDAFLTPTEAAALEASQRGFLANARDRLVAREAAGRVRDGHGDLRLEHVYRRTEGGFVIIDCIEFNDRFRYADVAADIAFLAMDLVAHARVDLAEAFLAAYAAQTDDYALYGVIDFYESYRAMVRAKVASLRATDETLPGAVRAQAHADARRHFVLALAADRKPAVPPQLIAVAGILASGKSTVARRIAQACGAPLLASDPTRKAMLSVAPTTALPDAPWQGAYEAETTEEVYRRLASRAETILRSGRSVVLDASFRARHHRKAMAQLARTCGVPFTLLECRAPLDLVRRRLQARAQAPSVSDGRAEILDAFLARWEPIDEDEPGRHLVVSTADAEGPDLDALLPRLAGGPPKPPR